MNASAPSVSYRIPLKFGYLDVAFCIRECGAVHDSHLPSLSHSHYDYELQYVTSGVGRIRIGEDIYTASENELLIIHPSEYHYQLEGIGRSGCKLYSFHLELCPPTPNEDLLPHHAYRILEGLLSNTRVLQGAKDSLLPQYLYLLSQELSSQRPVLLPNLGAICRLMLCEIVRLAGDLPEWFFPPEERSLSHRDRSAVDRFFESRYMHNVHIQELAEEMKLSVRHVARIMKETFGMTFTEKLTEVRLWEVARQLELSHEPASIISQACGFNNYNYFYVCFRKHFSMTPSEYRAQKRKEATK